VLCGLGRQDPRSDNPGSRQLFLLHHTGAGRCGRPDHPLELPDADGRVEVGPGARRGLYRRAQAGRADPAHRAADGRACAGGRVSRRSVNIVPGFGETAGAPLVAHKGVDKIAFTGETTTGKLIMKSAADTLKRVTLELGGKSPNIVFADADLDAAVDGAMLGLFLNQGQCCCAGSRLLVQEPVYDKMVEKLAERSLNRKLGDPFDATTE